jgi:hypothetical protein
LPQIATAGSVVVVVVGSSGVVVGAFEVEVCGAVGARRLVVDIDSVELASCLGVEVDSVVNKSVSASS